MTPKETFEADRNSKFKQKLPSLSFNMETRYLDISEVRAILKSLIGATPTYTEADRALLKSLRISAE